MIDPLQEIGKPVFKAFDQFKGVNTAERPIAIADDELSMLCNYMPIGNATLHKIFGPSAVLVTISSSATISRTWLVNLSNSYYIVAFMSDGSMYSIAVATWTATEIASAGTFTSPMLDVWNGVDALVIDPTGGYWSWNGTTFTNLTGTTTSMLSAPGTGYGSGSGIATTGGHGSGLTVDITQTGGVISSAIIADQGGGYHTGDVLTITGGNGNATITLGTVTSQTGYAIGVFKGRVWLATGGRTLVFSAPNSYTDFTTADGGGSFSFKSKNLSQQIINIRAQQDFLYVLGDHSITIITGITVSGAGATSFTDTEVVNHTGCAYPLTVDIFANTLVFDGGTGLYGMTGLFSSKRLSDELDGLTIDYTFPPQACTFHLYGEECYGYLAKVFNVDTQAYEKWIATFFTRKEKARWFFVRLGLDITSVMAYEAIGQDLVYASYGQSIVQLFDSSSTRAVEGWIRTKGERFGYPVHDKKMHYFGMSATSSNQLTFNLIIDSDLSYETDFVFTGTSPVEWVNDSGNPVTWVNNSDQPVGWTPEQDSYFQGQMIEGRGKRVLVDLRETSSSVYTIEALYIEGEIVEKWHNQNQEPST